MPTENEKMKKWFGLPKPLWALVFWMASFAVYVEIVSKMSYLNNAPTKVIYLNLGILTVGLFFAFRLLACRNKEPRFPLLRFVLSTIILLITGIILFIFSIDGYLSIKMFTTLCVSVPILFGIIAFSRKGVLK